MLKSLLIFSLICISICNQFEVVSDFGGKDTFGSAAVARTVTVFPNGGNNTADKVGFPMNLNDFSSFNDFAYAAVSLTYPAWVEQHLNDFTPDMVRIYDKFGNEWNTFDGIEDGSLLFVVKGEDHFFWPGLYVGHRIPLKNVNSGRPGKVLELVTLALEPRVFLIPDFITPEEAAQIIGIAAPMMAPSGSIINGVSAAETARNSATAWLGREYPAVLQLDRRVGELIKISHRRGHDELLQVLRYLPNQHYYAHTDWFKPEYYQHQSTWGAPWNSNRLLTFLFYLNSPEQGGETAFFNVPGYPGYKKKWGEFNTSDCSQALRVKPSVGDAVLFYDLEVDGHMDPIPVGDESSHHAGCDVIKGVKWAANKWVWNRPYHSRLHSIEADP